MSDPQAERVGASHIYGLRNRWEIAVVLAAVLIGLVVGFRYYSQQWVLDADGLSVASRRLPYWDFSNLWAGGKFALDGHVAYLFDAETYRAALRAIFGPALPDQEWSYPPSALLLGVPLALLPIFWAYVIWTAGSIAGLALALKTLRLPVAVQLALLASPGVVLSAMFGQNGALTAALMIAALSLSTKRPILAGVFAGLLTLKPHLGILIPFAYLASGNWRAVLSAGATSIALVLATGAAFGFEVWPLFLHNTAPLMAGILEAPYPQVYHANALTFFIFGRSLGLSVGGAYVFQAFFTLASIVCVVWLWRKANGVAPANRVVLTALLSICATPYGYTYDTVPFSLAVAWFFLHGRAPRDYLFGALWLCPYFAHVLGFWGYGMGVLVPAGLAVYGMATVWITRKADSDITAAASTPFQSSDSRPSAG